MSAKYREAMQLEADTTVGNTRKALPEELAFVFLKIYEEITNAAREQKESGRT